MKFNGILTLVVTVLAVVLISTACIIPVVQSAQSEQRTIENNTNVLYTLANPSVVDMAKVYDTDGTTLIGVSINDYVINASTTSTRAVIVAEDFIVELYTNANIQIFGIDSETNQGYSSSIGTSMHIEDGLITIVGSQTVTYNTSASFIFTASDEGNYCEVTSTIGLNADPDSMLVLCGDTTLNAEGQTGVRSRYVFSGTVSGANTQTGLTSGFCVGSGGSIATNISAVPTISQVEDQPYLSIKGNVDLSATYTVEDTPVVFSLNTNTTRIIAPVGYTTISENDSAVIAMLSIIPLLLFVIPIMLIVRSFGVGRD